MQWLPVTEEVSLLLGGAWHFTPSFLRL